MIPSGTAPDPQSSPRQGGDSANVARNPEGSVLDSRIGNLLPGLVLAIGFVARLLPAKRLFLNPDEALHFLLSSQSSLRVAYHAALTNAHPPLLILMLYYWRWFGHSGWLLRLPSVLAGTVCCWFVYQWLKLITDRAAAFIGLLLFTFSPSLIGLSAEIRQYALLLFFMACCLYLSERALRENSLLFMGLFSLSLYGALLTHYSSLFFAFTLGVYMVVRLYPYGKALPLVAIWGAGQVAGTALSGYFLITHVAHLRQTGMLRPDYEGYLRKSIFHAGERSFITFAAAQTLRVFTYLFSHGVVGTLALLAFMAGMILLLGGKAPRNKSGPSSRELALLLAIPFVANFGAALFGQYPYGGTRHATILAPFVVAGACIGLAAWKPALSRTKILNIVVALALCNVFPAPPPPIRARNQLSTLMEQATDYVRNAVTPGSVIFTDYQSGLLFGYYVCGEGVVQVFPPLQATARFNCGTYSVISTGPQEWEFYADDFPEQMRSMVETNGIAPGTKVWLFDAGWINASAPKLYPVLRSFGCAAPHTFGENISLCELTVPGNHNGEVDEPTKATLGK
jgi:4-amino-4-deoxy-L-arabinose transferase-like glycosyltransferase